MTPCLSYLDNFFLQLESPTRPMHWALILELGCGGDDSPGASTLDVDELRARVGQRMNRYRMFRLGVHSGDRYHPSLLEYQDVSSACSCVTSETVKDDADFHRLLSGLLAQRLLLDRPSWRIVLVDQDSPPRQRLVLLVHHAMSDGVAGAGYIALFADGDDPHLRPVHRFVTAERYPGPKVAASEFWPAAKGLVSMWTRGARSRRLRRVSQSCRRSVAAVQVPSAQVRRTAAPLHAGTSDFLIAAIGASVSRALHESNPTCPRAFRALIPITLDKDMRHTGNGVSMALINLAGEETPLKGRVQQVQAQLREIRNSHFELALPAAARVSSALPWQLQSRASRIAMSVMAPDLHIGVNPGYVRLNSVLGRPVRGVYPLSPLLGNPLSVTCLALGTDVHIGIVWDPAALSEDVGEILAGHLASLLPTARIFAPGSTSAVRDNDVPLRLEYSE